MSFTDKTGAIYCVELDGDKEISLRDLAARVAKMQARYGMDSVLAFDAGYNNVVAYIKPSKKSFKKGD